MEEKITKKIKLNLEKIQNIDSKGSEAIIHALVDIEESFEKIYKKIMPELSKNELSEDAVQNLLWDIREELRHIDYHIHDSHLLEL